MRKLLIAAIAWVAVGISTPASATSFTLDSYDLALRSVDPGLVVWEKDILADGTSFSLENIGDTYSAKLFTIGTDETATNLDDIKPYGINVSFQFSQPAPGFGGGATGVTGALGLGYVAWDNPALLSFGTTGLLAITLTDRVFTLPGSANVNASFTLVRKDSVPEPASLLLLGIGLGAVAFGKFRQLQV